MQKIPRCRNSSKNNRKKYKKYHAVATVPTPIEKIQKIPRGRNSSKTNRKNTTLLQQFQNQ
jgi:hypothetical protein